MKAKEYIKQIVASGTKEDMEKLSDMLLSLLEKMKDTDKECYDKYMMKLYIMAYGYKLNEDMAGEIIEKMKPYGMQWTLEETTEVMNKNYVNGIDKIDFWIVMNMAYNDYFELFGDELDKYINYTKLLIKDEDSKEGKVFKYFTEII
jgi:hypothetical protein